MGNSFLLAHLHKNTRISRKNSMCARHPDRLRRLAKLPKSLSRSADRCLHAKIYSQAASSHDPSMMLLLRYVHDAPAPVNIHCSQAAPSSPATIRP